MLTIENHKLLRKDGPAIRFVPTPNKRGRLKKTKPQFVIVHYTASGSLAGTVKWFENPASNVSAHLVIGRDGEIVQMGRFNQRLWHAGGSAWQGLRSLNSYSVGIELVNWGGLKRVEDHWRSWTGALIDVDDVYLDDEGGRCWHRYTLAQIDACIQVCRALCEQYGIATDDILGHADIAPRRKTDPGPAFPMNALRAHAKNEPRAVGYPDWMADRRSGKDRRTALDKNTVTELDKNTASGQQQQQIERAAVTAPLSEDEASMRQRILEGFGRY